MFSSRSVFVQIASFNEYTDPRKRSYFSCAYENNSPFNVVASSRTEIGAIRIHACFMECFTKEE